MAEGGNLVADALAAADQNVRASFARIPLLREGARQALGLGRFRKWDDRGDDEYIAMVGDNTELHTRSAVGCVVKVSVSFSSDCHCTLAFRPADHAVARRATLIDYNEVKALPAAGVVELPCVAYGVGPRSVCLRAAPDTGRERGVAEWLRGRNDRGLHSECIGHGSRAELFWLRTCLSDQLCSLIFEAPVISVNGRPYPHSPIGH